MRLICKLRGHLPGTETWNEGLFFATCERCRRDNIRQRGAEWEGVPLGAKVVWHPSGHQGLHWSKAISRARARRIQVREITLPGPRQAGSDEAS